MAKQKRSLGFDISSITNKGSYVFSNGMSIELEPLSLSQISSLGSKLTGLVKKCVESGITFTTKYIPTGKFDNENKQLYEVVEPNFKEIENLTKILEICLTSFPEILEEITGIVFKDLEDLPIETLLDIVAHCAEVNIKSKESFLKNWESLAGSLKSLGIIQKVKAEGKESQN